MGEAVTAFVVARPEANLDPEALRFAVPRRTADQRRAAQSPLPPHRRPSPRPANRVEASA